MTHDAQRTQIDCQVLEKRTWDRSTSACAPRERSYRYRINDPSTPASVLSHVSERLHRDRHKQHRRPPPLPKKHNPVLVDFPTSRTSNLARASPSYRRSQARASTCYCEFPRSLNACPTPVNHPTARIDQGMATSISFDIRKICSTSLQCVHDDERMQLIDEQSRPSRRAGSDAETSSISFTGRLVEVPSMEKARRRRVPHACSSMSISVEFKPACISARLNPASLCSVLSSSTVREETYAWQCKPSSIIEMRAEPRAQRMTRRVPALLESTDRLQSLVRSEVTVMDEPTSLLASSKVSKVHVRNAKRDNDDVYLAAEELTPTR